ncbi:unnamed protein product, partial [Symbiodinium necroappetens]
CQRGAATAAVKDFHYGGPKYWKAELADDVDISKVLECATNTIDAIDGDEAEEAINRLKQALSKCDDFIGKATFYGTVMPRVTDFKGFVDGSKVLVKRCAALSCESLLAFAHVSCKSIEWQARLIRHQLTEIMIGNIDEADLHPVLLQSAKSLVNQVGKQAREEKDSKTNAPTASQAGKQSKEEKGSKTKAPTASQASKQAKEEKDDKTKAPTASAEPARKKVRI